MAFSLNKFHDETLRAKIEAKPIDFTKARKPALKAIEKAEDAFTSATPTRLRGFKHNAGGVVWTLPFTIDGQDEAVVSADKFPAFLTELKAAIESGQFDATIAGHPKPQEGGGKRKGKRGPLSEESKAARRAKMAAKND